MEIDRGRPVSNSQQGVGSTGSPARTQPLQNPVTTGRPATNPADFQQAGLRARQELPESGGLMGWIKRAFGLGGNTLQSGADTTLSGLSGISAPSRTGGIGATTGTGNLGASQSTGAPTEDYAALGSRLKANTNLNYFEIERSNVNQGLSEYLGQFKQALASNPGMAEELGKTEAGRGLLAALDNASKGQIGTDDILNIQKFIVASGVDISTPNNASGIDGQYGPKTHAGLQAAFEQFKKDPTLSSAALSSGITRANQGVEQLRRAQDGEIDKFVPGKTPGLSPAVGPVVPMQSTDLGNKLVASAQQTVREMGTVGKCMKGVRTSFERAGIPLTDARGQNLPSAYMAADVLATRYSDRFTEKKPATREDLRNLPPGAVVVYDRNPDPAKRAANPNNGISHGHIFIADGKGGEFSDHYQAVSMNNNGRYGGFRIFLPNS